VCVCVCVWLRASTRFTDAIETINSFCSFGRDWSRPEMETHPVICVAIFMGKKIEQKPLSEMLIIIFLLVTAVSV